MAKIGEQFIDGDDNTFHVKETFDPNPSLDRIKAVREVTDGGHFGESRHVGTVPGWMLTQWLKEAGVSYTDKEGVERVLRQKLMSNEFSALRNWQGRF